MKKNLPLFLVSVILLQSCAFRSADQVIDRNKIPHVIAGVPSSHSEIRELSFNKVAGESNHKDLHIRGMLFTKKDNGGGGEMVPCSGCVVMMKGLKDTSVVIRMTTETDGYFNFHGESGVFALSLTNSGHNSVMIEPIQFVAGGVTSMVLVNASGSQSERFNVTHLDHSYTWTKQ